MGKRWFAAALLIWNCRDPSGDDDGTATPAAGGNASEHGGRAASGAEADGASHVSGDGGGARSGAATMGGAASGACSESACPHGGAAGRSTSSPQGGQGAAAASAGANGEGGASGAPKGGSAGAPDDLELCERFEPTESVDASASVGEDYVYAVTNDCRYQGGFCDLAALDAVAFLNEVANLAYKLWRCGEARAQRFDLIPSERTVRQQDAQQLIELYLDQMENWTLPLNAQQRETLRIELSLLAQSSVSADAASIDRCDMPCSEFVPAKSIRREPTP